MRTITASQIRRSYDLQPVPGRRVFIYIDDAIKVEMKYRPAKGAAGGYVWSFINPDTGRTSRLIRINTDKISTRRDRNQTPVEKFLAVQQKARDARRALKDPP
jgi:hypothetical protein